MNNFRKYIPILILLVLFFIVVKPFLNQGFFPMHDDTQVQRVYEMQRALVDKEIPVRWVPDLGYGLGYPLFNFYAPLPYYVGGFIYLAGFDVLLATKMMIILGIAISAFSMYLLTKEFWGKSGGLFSAVLYLYAPYHALDVYVRGDVGEVWAYSLMPLIFYGIWKTYKKQKFRYAVIGSLAYVGVIVSHNLSALMITPFILVGVSIAVYLSIKNKKNMAFIILIPLFGILLASFYFLPAILETGYTNIASLTMGSSNFHQHFVCVSQLWNSAWGFGGSIPGCVDGLSFRLGKIHILISIAAFVFALFFLRKEKEKSAVTLLALSFLLVSLFLTLSWSNRIWETVPFMSFLQYPWRFLLVSSLFSSFAGGFVVYAIAKLNAFRRFPKYSIYILIIILLGGNLALYGKLFVPQKIVYKTATDYTNSHELNWVTSKVSDEYMPANFSKPNSQNDLTKNKISGGQGAQISNEKTNTTNLSAEVNTASNANVLFRIPYFPAWKIYLDNKAISYTNTKQGLVISIARGHHLVEAKFQQTGIEKISNILSLSGFIALVLVIIYARKKRAL